MAQNKTENWFQLHDNKGRTANRCGRRIFAKSPIHKDFLALAGAAQKNFDQFCLEKQILSLRSSGVARSLRAKHSVSDRVLPFSGGQLVFELRGTDVYLKDILVNPESRPKCIRKKQRGRLSKDDRIDFLRDNMEVDSKAWAEAKNFLVDVEYDATVFRVIFGDKLASRHDLEQTRFLRELSRLLADDQYAFIGSAARTIAIKLATEQGKGWLLKKLGLQNHHVSALMNSPEIPKKPASKEEILMFYATQTPFYQEKIENAGNCSSS